MLHSVGRIDARMYKQRMMSPLNRVSPSSPSTRPSGWVTFDEDRCLEI